MVGTPSGAARRTGAVKDAEGTAERRTLWRAPCVLGMSSSLGVKVTNNRFKRLGLLSMDQLVSA